MINTSLFAPSKKITPRPPPSPRLRSASFTTNVLVRYPAWPRTPDTTRRACPAWQRVPQGGGERHAALHPRELPGGLRRKQHDADAARPRAAAAPVHILQPCGRIGGTILWRSCTWQTCARFASCCSSTSSSGSWRSWVPSCTRACATSRRCWPRDSWRGTGRSPSWSSAAPTSSWCASRRCLCPARGTQLEHLLERALPHLERADEGFKLLKVCA